MGVTNIGPVSKDILAIKITVGMMKLPFQILPCAIKIITFPFDIISAAFLFTANKIQKVASIFVPSPLNYYFAMPFYVMGASCILVVLPLKMLAFPYSLIVKLIDYCGNLALAEERAELQHNAR